VLRFILLALLLLLIARAFWKVVDSVIDGAGGTSRRGAPRARGAGQASVHLVRDPVCGTHVPPASSLSLTRGGTTHYFCSEDCRAQFSRQRTAGSRP
jgi:YHS domain-containing protein